MERGVQECDATEDPHSFLVGTIIISPMKKVMSKQYQ